MPDLSLPAVPRQSGDDEAHEGHGHEIGHHHPDQVVGEQAREDVGEAEPIRL